MVAILADQLKWKEESNLYLQIIPADLDEMMQ